MIPALPILLADAIAATPASGSIDWALVATLGMAIFTGLMWWDARKSRDTLKLEQPIQTQKVFPHASVRDLEERDAELKRRLAQHDLELRQHDQRLTELRELLHSELHGMEQRLALAGENRVVKLHDRINLILSAVSKLEGRIEE